MTGLKIHRYWRCLSADNDVNYLLDVAIQDLTLSAYMFVLLLFPDNLLCDTGKDGSELA